MEDVMMEDKRKTAPNGCNEEFTPDMKRALDEVVAIMYGESSPTLVAERAYWAVRSFDPAFLEAKSGHIESNHREVAAIFRNFEHLSFANLVLEHLDAPFGAH